MQTRPRPKTKRKESLRSIIAGLTVKAKATQEQIRELQLLLEEEQEVATWAESRSSTGSTRFRQNMKVTVANATQSAQAIEVALDSIKEEDYPRALETLSSLVEQKKTAKPSTSRLERAYAQYLMETDPAFHEWLKANGHSDLLYLVTTPQAEEGEAEEDDTPGYVAEGASNRPEDYE